MTQPTAADARFKDADGNDIIGVQQSAITAAVVAHALNATFSDTEVEAALDLLGTAINSIISTLEAHGLNADN